MNVRFLSFAHLDEHFMEKLLNMLCIFYLVGDKSNIGNMRETFFFNQMRVNNEVGGKNKQQSQLEKDGKSFVVKDDIEYGYRNVIPLWAFGLNY